MEELMEFRKWAEKWWQENDKTKNQVTASDIEFLGCRLRKAIDAVFGFEDCEEVKSMYDNVEINDIFPDMILPIDQEDEENNLSVLVAVGKMPIEKQPPYYRKKVERIKAIMRKRAGTINHLTKLEKAAPNDIKAAENRERVNATIEATEKGIDNIKAKLKKAPFGTEPIFKVVGEMEGELYNFLLKKIGRGGSVTPYSYADIQKGYWEKVNINDRHELYKLVKELCEKEGWHIAFGYGDFLNYQYDLEKFCKKIYFPQIYRCKEKADDLAARFANMIDTEFLKGNDQFLCEIEIFTDIDKKLDKLLKKAETISSSFTGGYIESMIEDFLSKDNQ